VEAAASQADCAPPFARAWLGLAGIDRPEDALLFRAQLAPLAAELRLTNDAELVLGGLRELPGVALIAGTGSIALGVDRAGRVVRVGGWGHLIGDEGSGYDIGRRALQAALRMADGRDPRGLLLDRVLAHFGAAGHEDLIERVYTQPAKSAIAALAPGVLLAARAGDPQARAIVGAAANELAHAATTAVRLLPAAERPPALALSGGLLVADAWYRQAVLRRVRRRMVIGTVSVIAEPALAAAQALAGGEPLCGTAAPEVSAAALNRNGRTRRLSGGGGRSHEHASR
jgi:N-acetylglucosamine kinase-like BadF-type ATPase